MIQFKVIQQSAGTGNLLLPRSCKWVKVDANPIRITIDGAHTKNQLLITIETEQYTYKLTDMLLEMMLEKLSEEYSSKYLRFEVYEKG